MNPSSSSETQVPEVELAETNQEDTTGGETVYGMDLDVYTAAKEGNTAALEKREHLHQMLSPTKNTVLHIYIACATSTNLEEIHESAKIVEKMLKICPPLLLLTNENGDTALHAAAKHGRTAIVKVLVQAAKEENQKVEGAWPWLIRTTNEEGDSSLHMAARFNHIDVVEILITEDPEFSHSANRDGETPLYMAVERGFRDLFFQILYTHKNPAYEGPNGRTCLHAAIIRNDKEMTGKLLEWKRELTKVVDDQGCTPLHLAASMGRTLIAKQLLECDRSAAYIKEKEHKRTALHFATHYGHEGVMKNIIRECPDCCELVDDKHQNILHTAIMKGQVALGHIALKDPWLSNVLLNGKDDNGDTPLHRIAYSKSLSFFFLGTRFATDARIDNMAFNKKNQNALNILQEDERNFAGAYMGQRLQDKLKQSGVVLGRRIVPNVRKTENVNKTVMKNEGDERGGKLGDTHLLVAILIATVSFAAGFTMPGGYQSDKGPDQGSAILSRSTAFQAFVVTNTIAMTLSSCAVFLNLYSSMYAKRNVLFTTLYAVSMFTLLALVAMVIAFITGTYAVLGHSSGLGITICVLGSLLFFVLYEVMIYDETALRVAIPLVPLSIFFLLIFFLMIKMFAVMGKLRHLCVGSNSSAPKREGRWSNSTPATSTSSQLRSDKEMVVYNRC